LNTLGSRFDHPKAATANNLIDDFDAILRSAVLDRGLLQNAALQRALTIEQDTGERLDVILVRLGQIAEDQMAALKSDLLQLPLIAKSEYPSAPIFADVLSANFLRHAGLLPLRKTNEGLIIAMINPLDCEAVAAITLATGLDVLPGIAVPAELEDAFSRLYDGGKSAISGIVEDNDISTQVANADDVEKLRDLASEAPVVQLVNRLIIKAIDRRASDIHIEPMDTALRVRYRVDGELQVSEAPPTQLKSAVISRIKIMGGLDIGERRLPQDGSTRITMRGKELDLRISTSPSLHGETAVIRVLDRDRIKLDFTELGFPNDLVAIHRELIRHPYGFLLVTGPTGSGKTTTLYASLQELNAPQKKILTIEDPIEYQLDGINQTQVDPRIGLTFASCLRAFLRHDPDVIMVGEIRDSETAKTAIHAALTGHLVMSTLHTNSAASALTRLLDMGIENYLLTSTVIGIVAQRLVRALCPTCREPYAVPAEYLSQIDRSGKHCANPTFYRPTGCERCDHVGYLGRVCVLEILTMSQSIRELVRDQAEAEALHAQAVSDGMRSMYQDGIDKALAGITSVEEVIRVTREH